MLHFFRYALRFSSFTSFVYMVSAPVQAPIIILFSLVHSCFAQANSISSRMLRSTILDVVYRNMNLHYEIVRVFHPQRIIRILRQLSFQIHTQYIGCFLLDIWLFCLYVFRYSQYHLLLFLVFFNRDTFLTTPVASKSIF